MLEYCIQNLARLNVKKHTHTHYKELCMAVLLRTLVKTEVWGAHKSQHADYFKGRISHNSIIELEHKGRCVILATPGMQNH